MILPSTSTGKSQSPYPYSSFPQPPRSSPVNATREPPPLIAGLTTADGGLLWLATPPGKAGYDWFPYLLHALVDLGFKPPFRGNRLWAFFDSSYRLRVDPDYLARQWRNSGIMDIHVAAWHYYDPDETKAAYLKKVIDACRREGVLVYAWLEMPHVREGFWQDNPQCHEKTATLQDAKLDWRKLIDLVDPECSAAVLTDTKRLLTAFEWGGIHLGELYFESLHGPDNPARFTPISDSVRAEAAPLVGFDPLELLTPSGPCHWSKQPEAWRVFVDYRADLALRLQEDWLKIIRNTFSDTDIVVTQIDDQFDLRMRELLGADAAKLLPLAKRYDFTLLIEDPAPLSTVSRVSRTTCHRHQHRRTLSADLSDPKANRRRTAPARRPLLTLFSPCCSLLRKLHFQSGPFAATAVRRRQKDYREFANHCSREFGTPVWSELEWFRKGRWWALPGS
jgi:hypothetical protein